MPDRTPPPANALEASERVESREHEMNQQRDRADTLELLTADLAKAFGDAWDWALLQADESNAERRKAAAMQTPLTTEMADLVEGWLVKHGWMTGFRPERVRDLRWLLDRTSSKASAHSARAYDRRDAMGAWRTVDSWAKQESAMTGEVSPPTTLRSVEGAP